MTRSSTIAGAGVLAAGLLLTGCTTEATSPAPEVATAPSSITGAPTDTAAGVPGAPAGIATGLDVPWDLAVLPDGSVLWVLTNNTHGGTPRDGDDRLVTVPLT